MKKLFLAAVLGVLSATGVYAGGTARHSAGSAQSRQINTAGHQTALHKTLSPAKAAGEAPANAVEVPFTHDLGKSSTVVSNYTHADANNDGRTWKYGTVSGYAACMLPNTAGVENADDWLFSVPVHLPAGNYTVCLQIGYMGTGATSVTIGLSLGKEPSVEGMTAEISPATKYTDKNMTNYDFNCAIPEEGYYYIGIHNVTGLDEKGTAKIQNLSMKSGSTEVPEPVDPPAAGTLTYVLADKGQLSATITYTAPTKTVSGADLEKITKVELTSRWTVDKYYFENVTPGQVIVQEVPMYAGINNRFTGVAYVDDTAGEMVEIKNIYCGPDTPSAPTDVTLTVNPDYLTATLSWTAPGSVGENGGYVDTENLTYYVFDAFGSYYDPAVYTTSATSQTISLADFTDLPQDFLAFQVTAGNGDLYSLDATSNVACLGTPDALPLNESFANGYYEGYWLIDPYLTTGSGTQNWGTVDDSYFASLIDPEDPDAPAPLKSQDGDNGFYYWLPYTAQAAFGLQSIRVDISAAAQPVLDFWYQGKGSEIDVLIAAGTSADFVPVKAIDLKSNPADGWTLARVPLDDFKAAGTVQAEILLRAVHNTETETWSVPFDNISIHDLAVPSLRLLAVSAPANVKPTETIEITARVENTGDKAADITLNLLDGEAVAATQTAEGVEPTAFAQFNLSYKVAPHAPAALDLHLQAGCNGFATSPAPLAVNVNRKNFATVADLTATANGHSVQLAWTEPVNEIVDGQTVTEDFENPEYTHMSINGAGGWTTYDGDGIKTYNVFRETYNPYQTAPMGFQLFNRETAQVPSSYWADAEAHSGDTYMLAPSAQGAKNDNWLISPALSGEAQTVTFWAKSYTVTWAESFYVVYSTTDAAPASFTEAADVNGEAYVETVPEVWTQYTVNLPAGATYFAIVHDTYDSLALFVDDVTYEAASSLPDDLAITGYHVIRNGETILDEPVSTNAHLDMPVNPDDYPQGHKIDFEYSVVPEYNHGFAAESNKAPVTITIERGGVDTITAGNGDAQTVYYGIDGRVVRGTAVTPGAYIAVKDGKATKVIVK